MRTIEVVDHDRRWSAAFDREAAAMCPVFGDALLTVHHIGSTAVRGLAAKPVIDILVVLRETGSIERFSAAMEHLGYRARWECRSPPRAISTHDHMRGFNLCCLEEGIVRTFLVRPACGRRQLGTRRSF